MCDRTQKQYQLVFQSLLDCATKNDTKLQSINIMLDFEQVAANAFLPVFKYSGVVFGNTLNKYASHP
jgi:hypothetical protein